MGPGHQHSAQVGFDENFNIVNFYTTPASDTPWHPPGLIDLTDHGFQPGQTSALLLNAAPINFREYRNAAPLISECGTYPNDSGYEGSAATIVGSVPSIHEDDHSMDAQAVELFMGFHVGHSEPTQSLSHAQTDSGPASSKHYCNNCMTPLSTKAELNKHLQRHSKPHTCTYAGCPRAAPGNGFGTPNDLARHKRSVHKEHDKHGPVFVCIHEPCRSKKAKIWPRADNFRSHLLRQHPTIANPEDDLQSYVFSPPTERRHDLQGIGQGMGPEAVGIDPNCPSLRLQDSPVLESEQAPDAELLSASPSQEQLDSLPVGINGEIHEADTDRFPHVSNDSSHHDYPVDEEAPETCESPLFEDDVLMDDTSTMADDQRQEEEEEEEEQSVVASVSQESGNEKGRWTVDESSTNPSGSGVFAKTLAEAQSDPSRLIDVLKTLKKIPKDILDLLDTTFQDEQRSEDKHESDEPVRAEAGSKTSHGCSDCSKVFPRLCELKKHRKRHDKPYGCTFRGCGKPFGSKNDWKRHESTQHLMLETWTCDVDGCQTVRLGRETFKSHLCKDHGLESQPQVVEEKLERCRMGRHCDPRFWCGFCERVMAVEEAEANPWKKRCDHIDNHLFGKGGLEKKRMSQWVYLVEDGEGEGDAGARSRKRKASGQWDKPRKRQTEGVCMWYCCICGGNATGQVYKTSPSCVECEHQKCVNCSSALVRPNDEQEMIAQAMEEG